MKIKQKISSDLIAVIITLVSIILVIFVFFLIKNIKKEPKSALEITDEKIQETNFDITFITPQEVFNAIRKEKFLIIDTRNELEFSENHIEDSVNIPLENLENYDSLPKDKTLIFVEYDETINGKKLTSEIKEAGYQINYLEGGLINYLASGFNLISAGNVLSIQDRAKTTPLDLSSLGERLQAGERFTYLDVRKKQDYEQDHFEKSTNIPLENLEKNKSIIPTGKLLIIDEDPIRSFKASVRLSDMNILSSYYLSNRYSELKDAIQNKTLIKEE